MQTVPSPRMMPPSQPKHTWMPPAGLHRATAQPAHERENLALLRTLFDESNPDGNAHMRRVRRRASSGWHA
jgi:hypothetical protein